MSFKVLCADPPWLFNDKLPAGDGMRGASRNYDCLTQSELCIFELPSLADDCVLAMWRVAAMQQEALNVIHAWGFTLKTEIVWLKKTKYGKRWFGMGHTTRAEHEVCLIATRGNPVVKNHSTRSTFVTDVDVDGLSATAGIHSAKPEQFYTIIEELFEGPYVELFARRQREGWTCLGNEIE